MSRKKPTYEEWEKRPADPEEEILALRDKKTDPAIMGTKAPMLLEDEQHDRSEVEDITDHRWTEEEVKACITFLGNVMEQSPFAMWISDPKGTVIRTNRALRKILNLTDEQILGKYNVLNDGNLVEQDVMDQVKAVFEERRSARFIIPWVGAKAGNVDFGGSSDLWIEVSMFPIIDKEEHLTNVVCQWISITERKQAEEALKKNEVKYRNIIKGALDGVVIVDTEGRILESNDAYCRMVGYSREELLEKSLKEIVADESPREMKDHLKKLWSEGKERFETKHRRKDGKIIDIEISVRCFDSEKGTTVGFLRDITERKQKENEIRISEEKYRSLIENMIDVIFTLDAEGILTSINASVKEMLGFEPDEIIGKHFTEWIPQNQKPVILSVFKRILDGEKIIDETVLIGKDGKAHDVEFHATCILKEDKVIGVQGILRDITESKKAEEVLRRTEEKYRMLFDGAIDAIFVADAKTGQLLDCNRAAVELTGREKSELIGQPQRILHPLQKNGGDLSETFKRHLGQEQGQTLETQIITKSGNIRGVAIKASLLEVSGKKVLLGVFRDITEHKHAQEEIESLSKFPAENPSPVLRVHKNGTVLYSNEAGLPLLADLKSGVGENAPSKWRELIDGAFEFGTTQQREQEIGGRIFSFVIAPILDGDYVNLYARDISERKKTEADLRKSEERFMQVAESAGDWIWEVDAEGLYTYASPVVEKVLGYKPEEIVGKNHFYDFFQPEVRKDLKEAAFKAFMNRKSFRDFVNPNVHKDGRIVIFETSGTPIIDEKGNFCGYRGVDRDITERTQRENKLRELNKDLALASRRAGTAEVATDILHNVGNVLNSINVSAKFIEEKVKNSKVTNLKKVVDILTEHTGDLVTFLTEDERGKHIPLYLTEVAKFILNEQAVVAEKFKSLTKNVEHVMQIIKSQQSYARSGGIETNTDVHEIIENAMEINHVTLERYGIDLRCELDELPRIYMDKQRVLQILVNLITNAKQALLESEEQSKVLIIKCYKYDKDKLRIEVTDNGVGISKENIPNIFTHGFTTKKSGHGFGLHSSALAAREMSGSLTVHSDGPGRGATFILELPLKSEPVTNEFRK